MKIRFKSAKSKSAPLAIDQMGRGRPTVFGGKRANFYPGTELWDDIFSVQDDFKLLKLGALTTSFIFREGARLYLAKLRSDLKKSRNGSYHAKKRKDLFGK